MLHYHHQNNYVTEMGIDERSDRLWVPSTLYDPALDVTSDRLQSVHKTHARKKDVQAGDIRIFTRGRLTCT